MTRELPDAARRFRLRPEHLDLLTAALAPVHQAAAAYRRWQAAVPLADTDAGSYRLIPLVAHNLDGHDVIDETAASRYRRMTRFTWVKSTLIRDRAVAARATLADARIESLAIKGLAVIRHCDLDLALRPMDDADIIVRPADTARALAVLAADGYVSDEVDLADPDRLAPLIAGHHGLNLRDSSGVQVDLHWHAIPHALHPDADHAMWRRAGDGVPSREDTLIQVLAHATRWSWAPSVQWLADATLLTRNGMDWPLVEDQVRALRLGVPVADGLEVLAASGLAPIPAKTIRRLRRAPISQRIEARVRRDAHGDWRPSTDLERLADAFGDHVRRAEPPGRRAGVATLGRFLAERWALTSPRAVPRHAFVVALGRPRLVTQIGRVHHGRGQRRQRGNRTARWSGEPADRTWSFAVGGNGLDLLGGGWSFPENHGSWTIGTEAALRLPLIDDDASRERLRVTIKIVPFLGEHVRERRVDVFVDGKRVARWDFAGSTWSPQERHIDLHRSAGNVTDALDVRFVIQRPIAPQAVDHDVGTRQLGLSLSSVQIERFSGTQTGI